MRPMSRAVFVLLVGSICLAGGFALGLVAKGEPPASVSLPAVLRRLAPAATGVDTFEEVWNRVHREFVTSDVDDTELVRGAIRGVVDALGDPYSVYLEPSEAKEFAEDIEGVFDGIGMEVGFKNGSQLTIIAPLPDSPAQRAGLRSGDVILGIDDRSTAGMKIDEAIKAIRGPRGTTVSITFEREGSPEPMTVKITRERITVESVTAKTLERGGKKIGYIKIASFNMETARQFQRFARAQLADGVAGFVVDMRDNPGGYLDQAVKVGSALIPNGPIVKEVQRDGAERTLDSTGDAFLSEQRVVVLVNGGSASASEIVAGAWQDTRRATVIGQKTFGKGSVQDLQSLSDGSSLKLTVAKWLTPNGRSISEAGIVPDVLIERTSATVGDPELDRAQEIIANGS